MSRHSSRPELGIFRALVVVLLLSSFITTGLGATRSARADNLSGTYNWQQLKIGGGGFATGIVFDLNGVAYARTDVGGAYRWDEGSQTWTQLLVSWAVPNPTKSDYEVESIATSRANSQNQALYLAVGADDLGSGNPGAGRILKSTNGGSNWTEPSGQHWRINGNGDLRQGGERLAVDPHNDNVVYFGSRTEGLWVSNDAGSNWGQVSTGQVPVGSSPGGVKFVVFDPNSGTNWAGKTNRIYVGVADNGVYTSGDAGNSWYQLLGTDGSSNLPYSAEVSSTGTLFVGFDYSVRRYTPSSNTWDIITPPGGGNYFEVAVDPFNSQRVFAAPGGLHDGFFWRTTNAGDNWDTLNITLSSPDIGWITYSNERNYLSAGKIAFNPNTANQLWFPQGIGVWRATNLSDSNIVWNFVSKGIEETVTADLIAPPGGKPVSAIYDRQGFYHNDVNAYPSKNIVDDTFYGGTSLNYSGNHPNFVVVAEFANNHWDNSVPGRAAWSSDGGQNWNVYSGLPSGSDAPSKGGNIAVAANSTNNAVWLPSTLNINAGHQPYYTFDNGATWNLSNGVNSTATHGLAVWGSKRALDADKVNDGTYYLVTYDGSGDFYTSTDGGQNYVKAANAPTCQLNDDCHVFGQLHAVPGKAKNVWSSDAKGGLFYTTDAGATPWTKVANVQTAYAFGFGATLSGASYPTIYMFGTVNNQKGIYRSSNQGASWDLVAIDPKGIYDDVNVVTGDMNVAGRVYVGFTGNGFIYGDTTATTGTTGGNNGGNPVTLNPTDDRNNDADHSPTKTYLDISMWAVPYLKFDLSSVGSVSSAKLRVYRPDLTQGALTLSAYKVSDNNWTEQDSNLPPYGDQLTATGSSSVGYVELDVTSYVQAAKAAGSQVSVALKTDKGGWQGFYSKDNGSNEPELVIAP